MALQEHVESLRAKHVRLERLIDEEMHRPLPDQSRVTEMKREKLRLKEELERLRLQGDGTTTEAPPHLM
ncbi:MAG: DUF465 domain-containing protein [Geminicoccaceae bacterium]|nr:DUF465 domain-containing protein [Geminicoccaceae bacterium]